MKELKRITVALDAMGGDFAPKETVKGAVLALDEDENISVLLYGREDDIAAELSGYQYDEKRIGICHAPDVIENTDPPVKAIRTKKDSSMVLALKAVKDNGADAFISCGNTGAILVGGQLIIGRIKGIERAALGFMVPTLKGACMLIDVGANADARPEMLLQFAKMGSIYLENALGIQNPKVGLVNIGEEEEKGNALVKETFPLLKNEASINFTGSVESRGIPAGLVDIAVCDAFVGNTILKMYEGVSAAVIKKLKETLTKSFKTKIGAALIKSDLKNMLKEFSADEYGGAPMLGLQNLVVKTHGNSKAAEIKNAILQCRTFINAGISDKIRNSI